MGFVLHKIAGAVPCLLLDVNDFVPSATGPLIGKREGSYPGPLQLYSSASLQLPLEAAELVLSRPKQLLAGCEASSWYMFRIPSRDVLRDLAEGF